LPALEFLKAEYTEVWIPSPLVPLIQFADRVQALAASGIELFGIGRDAEDRQLLERLCSFDQIVSWYGSKRLEFRTALAGLGFDCVFHDALPPDDSSLHATDFFAAQVGAPAGLIPRLQIQQVEARGSVVLHPFSGSARKNWPLDRYRELASLLPGPVEWLAGPEQQLADAVRMENLGELARWLAGARAYVGNDSGITHLAAAVGVPTVALFGPTEPGVWCPRGENVRMVRQDPLEKLPVAVVRALVQYGGHEEQRK
jgi:heptosyltransferase III